MPNTLIKNPFQSTESRNFSERGVVIGDDFLVRDMQTEDLSCVVKIEQMAQVSPWARLSFEESLTKGYRCRLVEINNDVVAYSVVSSVMDELHILNVVCAPVAQGMGLGHVLMKDMMTYADTEALCQVFLEVRASNLVAQGLYKKWGFDQIAVRKEYYRSGVSGQPREDAHVYCRKLT